MRQLRIGDNGRPWSPADVRAYLAWVADRIEAGTIPGPVVSWSELLAAAGARTVPVDGWSIPNEPPET